MKRHSLFRLIGAVACLAAELSGCDQAVPLGPEADQTTLAANAAAGPGVASNLSSSAVSPAQVDLSWQDNSTNETGWEVHRSTTGPDGAFTLLATASANVTSYSDTGLTPLTQYCYKVRSFRTTGKRTTHAEFSNTSCSTTLGPPPVPSNANAAPAHSSVVHVTWTDNSGTEDGFRVERSASSGGPWEIGATTGPNATSYGDGSRASEQQVCYRVIAFNAHGASGPSNADCTAPPAGPTNLSAATVAQGIDLAWADNSAVEDGYEVQRATDGVTFSTLAHVPANSTTYHDATATSSTTYWYRVRAKRDGGFSDLSNVASAQGSCVPSGPAEICGNGVEDDDCDGQAEGFDPDCPLDCGAQECPSGYVCDIGTGFCVPHCNDGAWNGDEGDTDCGGACETKCQAGQKCSINFDCASGQCVGNSCQP